jgi:DNA primase
MGSAAWHYLQQRKIRPLTILQYGLGFGVPKPLVNSNTVLCARHSRLVGKNGEWLWAGGVVYADPPLQPVTIQVRHLRKGAIGKYQTWGRLIKPLGAWRIQRSTKIVVVVEGFFDLLAFSQALHNRDMTTVIPLYTGGSSISWMMRNWFEAQNHFGYFLVPDPDEAGEEWTKTLQSAIQRGKGICHIAHTPKGLDPDEAIFSGWWPKGLEKL